MKKVRLNYIDKTRQCQDNRRRSNGIFKYLNDYVKEIQELNGNRNITDAFEIQEETLLPKSSSNSDLLPGLRRKPFQTDKPFPLVNSVILSETKSTNTSKQASCNRKKTKKTLNRKGRLNSGLIVIYNKKKT